jgi:Mn-dependent DtxR family transcriptional regulator
LRALWESGEILESESNHQGDIKWSWLLKQRVWSERTLYRLLSSAKRKGLVSFDVAAKIVQLTDHGRNEAARVVRNHRLWELYLIHYADIAPSHVDRDADDVEHVIGSELVRELEVAIRESGDEMLPPESPHKIEIQL